MNQTIPHSPRRGRTRLQQLNALKLKGSMDELVCVFAEDFQQASAAMPKEIKVKFTTK